MNETDSFKISTHFNYSQRQHESNSVGAVISDLCRMSVFSLFLTSVYRMSIPTFATRPIAAWSSATMSFRRIEKGTHDTICRRIREIRLFSIRVLVLLRLMLWSLLSIAVMWQIESISVHMENLTPAIITNLFIDYN